MTSLDSVDHENKLVRLHAQLSAAMMDRGLRLAKADDPHLYASAHSLLTEPSSRFELRIVVDPQSGAVSTRGVVCDAGGEALVDVFTITAQQATAQ